MPRQTATFALLAIIVGLATACSDASAPGGTGETGAGLVVSQLLSQPAPAVPSGRSSSVAAVVGTGVVYVSLVPGTVPSGLQATIRDEANGLVVTTPVVNGGFDPVALAASVGDTVVVDITNRGSSEPFELVDVVRPIRPPRVVRTSPPSGGHDVPLNANIVIVFSEPIDPTTLNAGSVRLWRRVTAVPGTVQVADSLGIRVRFHPDSLLAGQVEYRLVVTQAIRDVNGSALDSSIAVSFTTGTQALTFASVSAGQIHTCALTTGGRAYCWGDNVYGEIGDGTIFERLTPVPAMGGLTFATLSAGTLHNCGQTAAGSAYCWGDDSTGQLGDGDTTLVRSPALVRGGITFAAVSAGGNHTCGRTSGGLAYCWGANSSGQLGVGDTIQRTSPAAVLGGLRFAQVTAGYDYTCGITMTGPAYCWGDNSMGVLGDATLNTRTTPVAVVGGLGFAAVRAGRNLTCGVTTVGVAYCWGAAFIVGPFVGPALPDSAPWAVPAPVSGGLSFAALSVGWSHACGVTTAGPAYCWGDNSGGQLGDGTTTHGSGPVEVLGGLKFAVISAGALHTCGVTTAGLAYCWGDNSFGTLGDGTIDSSFAPVQVTP